MADKTKSGLRVFLSADLVGSTKLKNRLNHQELLEKYRSRCHVVEKLRMQDGKLPISEETERAAVLESLGVSTDDYDWATVVQAFYEGIHSGFVAALETVHDEVGSEIQSKNGIKPWKAVGDELIYAISICGRRELHLVTIAFLQAVRELDSKIGKRPGSGTAGLRIKGAAWVAGFPVRNREILLPAVDRPDFLGPEMDTGFRIGKCTRAGMLVVSVEMAELLSECQAEFQPMRGKIVGWETLKGVWNDQRYPVIWVDFPDQHPAAQNKSAAKFSPWDQEECRWCKAWEDGQQPKQLSEIASQLRELRNALPPSLGIVDPYILDDKLETGQLPKEHEQILKLLSEIDRHRSEANRQDAGETARDESRSIESDVAQVSDLLNQPILGAEDSSKRD